MKNHSQCSDGQLITLALGGSREAFDRLIERHHRSVFGVAFAVTGSLADAEDVTQETFIHAYRQLARLRDPDAFGRWVTVMARRLARANRRARLRREEVRDLLGQRGSSEPKPPEDDAMERDEAARLLERELGHLPEKLRLPLVLFYFEDESVSAVARRLGLTSTATRKRLERGRNRLRERLLQRLGTAFSVIVPPDLPDRCLGRLLREPLSVATTTSTASSGLATVGILIMSTKKTVLLAVAAVAIVLVGGGYLVSELGDRDDQVADPVTTEAGRLTSPALSEDSDDAAGRGTTVPAGPRQDSRERPHLSPRLASIEGLVLDQGTSQPFADCPVRLLATDEVTLIAEAESDAAGRFRFDDLGPGRYRVEPGQDELVVLEGDSAAVDLTQTLHGEVTLLVQARYPIGGIVVEAGSDRGVGGLTLHLRRPEGERWETLAETDASGRFETAEGLRRGEADVVAEKPAHLSGSDSLVLARVHVGEQDLRNLRLEHPWNGALRGRVVDTSGRAIAGAEVRVLRVAPGPMLWSELWNPEGRWRGMRTVFSGEDGRFRLDNLPPDRPLTLAARAADFASALTAAYEATPEGGEVLIEFDRPGRILGHVWYEDGRAAEGATVFAWPEGGGPTYGAHPFPMPGVFSKLVTADSRGSFEIRGVAAGSYVVGAYLGELRAQSPPAISVREGETVRVDVQLEAAPGELTISGAVVDELGSPLANVHVGAELEGMLGAAQHRVSTQTDPEGQFTLENLLGGNYRLRAQLFQAERFGKRMPGPVVLAGTQGVEIVYSVPRSRVTIRAIEQDSGELVSDAQLFIHDKASQPGIFSMSMSEGESTLVLCEGDYELVAGHRSLAPGSANLKIPPDETIERVIDLRLAPGRRVRGQVLDADGLPVAGAQVAVVVELGELWLAFRDSIVASDAEGGFEIDSLPARGGHLGLVLQGGSVDSATVQSADATPIVLTPSER